MLLLRVKIGIVVFVVFMTLLIVALCIMELEEKKREALYYRVPAESKAEYGEIGKVTKAKETPDIVSEEPSEEKQKDSMASTDVKKDIDNMSKRDWTSMSVGMEITYLINMIISFYLRQQINLV